MITENPQVHQSLHSLSDGDEIGVTSTLGEKISRREFLHRAGLLVFAGALSGCISSEVHARPEQDLENSSENRLVNLESQYGVHIARADERYAPRENAIRDKLSQVGKEAIFGRELKDEEIEALTEFFETLPYAKLLMQNVIIATNLLPTSVFSSEEKDSGNTNYFNGFFDYSYEGGNLYVFAPECLTASDQTACDYEENYRSPYSDGLHGAEGNTNREMLLDVLLHESGHAVEVLEMRKKLQKEDFLRQIRVEDNDSNPILQGFYKARGMEKIYPGDIKILADLRSIKKDSITYHFAGSPDGIRVESTDGKWDIYIPFLDQYVDPRIKNFQEIPQQEFDILSARTILYSGRESWADFWMHYHRGTILPEPYREVYMYIETIHNTLLGNLGEE